MEQYLSDEEVCAELGINAATLEEYLNYLGLQTGTDGVHIAVARTLNELHELVSKGLSLHDIRYLSFCAEQFEQLVPSLRNFKDFSPKSQLQNLVQHYHEITNEWRYREAQYKRRILDLEQILENFRSEIDEAQQLKKQVEKLSLDKERYKFELSDREEEIKRLNLIAEEQEYSLREIAYNIAKKDSFIEQLQSKLQYVEGQDDGPKPKTAIDIESLLKKKEREVMIKHQKQIFDLKRQVELMVEKKEQEWLRKA